MRTFAAVAVCVVVVAAGVYPAVADVFNMPAGQVSLPFVTVGDPGNRADDHVMGDGTTGYGSAGYVYQMGKFEVTASQYTQFLNAVAGSDTYGLYNLYMAPGNWAACGIARTGSPGQYRYSVTAGHENFPVNYVSWGDAARFCNWLSNGQPAGSQGPGITETGSYTLNGATTDAALMAIARSPNARYVIPTADEWYKAAYYKGGGIDAGYWDYPTCSNTMPNNIISGTGANNANYFAGPSGHPGYPDPINYLTAVGTFAGSPSAYGTFDQGGNVTEWNQTAFGASSRGVWGGHFSYDIISATFSRWQQVPADTSYGTGFRVALVPEPASLVLLAMCSAAMLARRRSR